MLEPDDGGLLATEAAAKAASDGAPGAGACAADVGAGNEGQGAIWEKFDLSTPVVARTAVSDDEAEDPSVRLRGASRGRGGREPEVEEVEEPLVSTRSRDRPMGCPPGVTPPGEIWVPPAIVPPKGLGGLFDDYDPTAVLDTSQFPPNMVLLNVYDIGDSELFQRINKVATGNNSMLIGGVFHAGVEVYGDEWCYGFTEDGSSGVSRIAPRTHPQHTYRTTVPMGVTHVERGDMRALLVRMSGEWPGSDYNLIRHNCLSFCNAFCAELGVGRIPGWIDRAARTAVSIDDTSKTVAKHTEHAVGLARSVTTELDAAVRPAVETVRNLVPGSTDEAQTIVTEAVETARRQSIEAVELARKQSMELAETASVQAAELGEAAMAHGQVLAGAATEQGQALVDATQEHARVVGQRVSEHAEVIAEQAQVLSSSLWSWGQGLRDAAARAIGDERGGAAGGASGAASSGAAVVGTADSRRRTDPRMREAGGSKAHEASKPPPTGDLLGDLLGFTGGDAKEDLRRAPTPGRQQAPSTHAAAAPPTTPDIAAE